MNGKKINLNKLMYPHSKEPKCPNCGVSISRSTVIRTNKGRNRLRRCNNCSFVYGTVEKINSSRAMEAKAMTKMRELVADLEKERKENAELKEMLRNYQHSLPLE